jgi:hypothetical protein
VVPAKVEEPRSSEMWALRIPTRRQVILWEEGLSCDWLVKPLLQIPAAAEGHLTYLYFPCWRRTLVTGQSNSILFHSSFLTFFSLSDYLHFIPSHTGTLGRTEIMNKSFVTKAKTVLQETITFSHHTLRPQKHPVIMMNKITGHPIMHSFHPCPQFLPYLNQKFLAGCWGPTCSRPT